MLSINVCKKRGRALRIAVGTLIIFLVTGGASALSNDGGGSWIHSRDITINNSGSPLIEYQVLVNPYKEANGLAPEYDNDWIF